MRILFYKGVGPALLFALALFLLLPLWAILPSFAQTQAPQAQMGQSQTAQPQPAQPPQKADISVDVKLVNVLATVRDKKGAIVRNLTKDDFVLEEDDRPQSIAYFSQESDLPLTLGLLVDTSMSQRTVLSRERTASYAFIDHMLREKDKAFVIHFDQEVELLQDLTPSREKLSKALELLETPERDNGGGGGGNGGSGGGPGGGNGRHRGGGRAGTLLYDAIYLASNDMLKPIPGRKAIVVLTDGVDRGSRESLETAIESAQRADTLVFSILFAGEEPGNRGGFGGPRMGGGYPGGGGGGGWPGGGGRGGGRGGYPREERPDGKKVLQRLSQETGGQMYEVTKKQSIEEIYARIEEGLRHEYLIAYTPDKPEMGYHKIHLSAKNKDFSVQSRDGYYAK